MSVPSKATLTILLTASAANAAQTDQFDMSIGFYSVIVTMLILIAAMVFYVWTRHRSDQAAISLLKQKLKGDEARLEFIRKLPSLGFFEANRRGNILDVNETYCRMSGYSREELFSMSIADIESLEDEAQVQARISGIIAEGTDRFDSKHKKKNGTIYDVEISATFIQTTGRLFCVVYDISDRHNFVAEISESERRLRSIFENSPLGIIRFAKDGTIADCNSRFIQLMGSSYEELIGFDTLNQGKKEMQECLRTAITGKMAVFEDEYTSVTGEKTTQLRVVFNPVNVGQSPTEVIATLEDIAERKAQERALRHARDTAEEATRSKSEFLANMSHEIRTPLNGVLGMLQLLGNTTLDDEQTEYVDTALLSSKRLTRLLSDILDISRIEADRLEVTMEPFHLRESIRVVEHLFVPVFMEENLALNVEISPDTPEHVIGDSVRLQQILSNLVGNAIKFTSKGGVTVSVSPLPIRRGDEIRVLFMVQDTGIGIPENKLEDLFEAFTQAESDFRRRYQGAGLGLAITKRLVHLMQGNLSLESNAGKGSTFYFTVPFEPTTVSMQDNAPATDGAPSRVMRVLIAEDDMASTKVLLSMFQKLKHEALVVNNGRDVLKKLQESEFDLVLMDIQMPIMDGVEATLAIRTGQAGKSNTVIPIVAMTAYAMRGDKERFLASGIDEYLAKPVNLEDLQALLDELATQK